MKENGLGYLRLLFRNNPTKLDYIILLIGILAAIAAGVPFPVLGVLFGQLIDDLNSATCNTSQQTDSDAVQAGINQKVLLMIYVTIANFAAIYIHAGCWSLFGERLVGRLRQRYFQGLLRQEIAFFDTLPPGETSARLSHDIEIVRAGTSEKVGIFISSFSYFVGAYLVAFIQVARLAGMLAFLIPAYMLMVLIGGAYVGRYTKSTSDRIAAASSIVSQSLSNVALVQALGAERRLEAKFAKILGEAQKEGLKKAIVAAAQFGSLFLIAYSANALAFWQGSKTIAGTLDAGGSGVTAGAVYTVIFLLIDASLVISQVAPILQVFGSATAAARALQIVIERPSSIDGTLPATENRSKSIQGELEFRNVTFLYPSRPDLTTLDGVSLRFPVGKHTAIVGASGSGKSTITSLLVRLYDPLIGGVFLDGRDYRDINVRTLRGCIGLVDQQPFLLNRSIFENIALGLVSSSEGACEATLLDSSLPDMVDAVHGGEDFDAALRRQPSGVRIVYQKVRQAATRANADHFIQTLEHGYATLVGMKGGDLSGGQRQRIALARALIKDPKVLLLDEATSALDSTTEHDVQESLKDVLKGRTTVTVAHRLSTVRDADNIVVLRDGRVIEEGTHSDLVSKQGAYAAMIEAQHLQLSSIEEGRRVETSPASSSSVSSSTKYESTVEKRSPRMESHKDDESRDKLPSRDINTIGRGISALIWSQPFFVFSGIVACILAGGSYTGEAVLFGHTLGHFDPCQGKARIRSTGKLSGLLFFIIGLVAFCTNLIGGSAFGRVSEKMIYNVRLLTFRSLFHQNLAWHKSEGRTPASLLQYFTRDTNALAGLSGTTVGTVVTILVNLIASIIVTHVIAWKIAIILLATLPILLGSGIMRLQALAKFQSRHQTVYASSINLTVEAVESIQVVVALSLESYFLQVYRRSLAKPHKEIFREIAYTNFWLATAFSVSNLIYALAYWWGAKQIVAGKYSQTEFFIVLPALLFSAQSCGQMFALAPDMSGARIAATRLLDLLSIGPSAPPSLRPQIEGSFLEKGERGLDLELSASKSLLRTNPPPHHGMAIKIEGVHFDYPSRPSVKALCGINMSIFPGQFCALVGPSGAGKSTIISLLEIIYEPSSGHVEVDGRNVALADKVAYRDDIALVPQDSTLFDGSVRFNIALGARTEHDATNEEIETACRLANVHDVISGLPQGYETPCGANGDRFSGGQKQRMCIARALVRRPRLLLLDEPTSALDAESETHFQQTLDSVRGQMTIVVVAHRLHTIQKADRIFLIEGGRCVDQGTHGELVQRSLSYRANAVHQALDT